VFETCDLSTEPQAFRKWLLDIRPTTCFILSTTQIWNLFRSEKRLPIEAREMLTYASRSSWRVSAILVRFNGSCNVSPNLLNISNIQFYGNHCSGRGVSGDRMNGRTDLDRRKAVNWKHLKWILWMKACIPAYFIIETTFSSETLLTLFLCNILNDERMGFLPTARLRLCQM
jgi:hypothetical protein